MSIPCLPSHTPKRITSTIPSRRQHGASLRARFGLAPTPRPIVSKLRPITLEFVRPQGWVNLVATGLMRTPDAFALLALTRSPGAAFVEPAEWHLLESLAPHLQRAAAVHALLARTRATANSLVAAAGFAVF